MSQKYVPIKAQSVKEVEQEITIKSGVTILQFMTSTTNVKKELNAIADLGTDVICLYVDPLPETTSLP